MKLAPAFCMVLLFYGQISFAGGFTWTCTGQKFTAQWNGKPVSPIGEEIGITFLPENHTFNVKVTAIDNIDGTHSLNLEGEMNYIPVQAIIVSKGLGDTRISVYVEGYPAEENIECLF